MRSMPPHPVSRFRAFPEARELGFVTVAPLVETLRRWIGRGVDAVTLAKSLARGLKQENDLTNEVFFARHPELGRRKLRSHERRLIAEWLDIRDRVVRPTLARLTRSEGHGVAPMPASQRVNPRVVAEIRHYDTVIEKVSRREGIDPNWVRGVIAAESGGNRHAGRPGGYRGLMQAEKGEAQVEPVTSIESGVRKLKRFRRIVVQRLRDNGVDSRKLGEDELIRLTMIAYNAGPGTLRRAMASAAAAGEPDAWFEPRHFQRTLIYFGAYSIPAALGAVLSGPDGGRVTHELAMVAQITPAEFVRRYRSSDRWNAKRLWRELGPRLRRIKETWKKKWNVPFAQLVQKVPSWLLRAVEFKHRNLRTWYVDRVLAYKRHFEMTAR